MCYKPIYTSINNKSILPYVLYFYLSFILELVSEV